MPNLSPSEVLAKYRDKISSKLESKSSVEVNKCKEEIREFVIWTKKVMVFLDAFKRQVRTMVPVKEAQNHHYRVFADLLGKYEELNVSAKPTELKLRDRVGNLTDDVRNPFKEMLLWVKEEILDLHSVLIALSMREQLFN